VWAVGPLPPQEIVVPGIRGAASYAALQEPAVTMTSARARHNSLKRYRADDDPQVVAARRALRDARLEDHVRKIVADAPDLTAEQRSRLAVLLLTPGAAA